MDNVDGAHGKTRSHRMISTGVRQVIVLESTRVCQVIAERPCNVRKVSKRAHASFDSPSVIERDFIMRFSKCSLLTAN